MILFIKFLLAGLALGAAPGLISIVGGLSATIVGLSGLAFLYSAFKDIWMEY